MNPRKSSPLGPLVGLMFISVLALALTGLFGTWYSHQGANAALAKLSALSRLLNSARETQVEFKTQVQYWKNLLLRGQDPKDFADYTKKFESQTELVSKNLGEVLASPELPAELKPEVEAILRDHQELQKKYAAALALYSSADPSSIFRADEAVRGIDQPVNARIDQLAATMVDYEAKWLEDLRVQAARTYHNLCLAMMIVAAFSVFCAGALAWRALRVRA